MGKKKDKKQEGHGDDAAASSGSVRAQVDSDDDLNDLEAGQGEDGGRWESIEALVDADTPEAREKLKQQLLGMKDWWSDGKKGDGQDPDSAKETKPSKKEKGERGNLDRLKDEMNRLKFDEVDLKKKSKKGDSKRAPKSVSSPAVTNFREPKGGSRAYLTTVDDVDWVQQREAFQPHFKVHPLQLVSFAIMVLVLLGLIRYAITQYERGVQPAEMSTVGVKVNEIIKDWKSREDKDKTSVATPGGAKTGFVHLTPKPAQQSSSSFSTPAPVGDKDCHKYDQDEESCHNSPLCMWFPALDPPGCFADDESMPEDKSDSDDVEDDVPTGAIESGGKSEQHSPTKCGEHSRKTKAQARIDAVRNFCWQYEVEPVPACSQQCKDALVDFNKSGCVDLYVEEMDDDAKETFLQLRQLAFKRCYTPLCVDKQEAKKAWVAIAGIRGDCEKVADAISKSTSIRCDAHCISSLLEFDANPCATWILEQVVGQLPSSQQNEFWLGYNATHKKCIDDQQCTGTSERNNGTNAVKAILNDCAEYDLLPIPQCRSKCKDTLVMYNNSRCADVMAAEKAKSERTNFVNIKDLAEKRCLHEGCEDAPTLKVAWTAIDDLRDWCAREADGDSHRCHERCAKALVIYDSNTCVPWIMEQMVAQMKGKEQTEFWSMFNSTRTMCHSKANPPPRPSPVSPPAGNECDSELEDILTNVHMLSEGCKNAVRGCTGECQSSLNSFKQFSHECTKKAIGQLEEDDEQVFRKVKAVADALCKPGR